METLSQAELETLFPEAYNALPQTYQADSCLRFWEKDGVIHCGPKPDQVSALGNWTATYNPASHCWE